MTPLKYFVVIIGVIVLPIAVRAALSRLDAARRYWRKHNHKHGFWYEVVKDFAAPVLLAILVVGLGYEFNKQRDIQENNQRQGAILRDMMTTRNGPDIAFFTAVGERLRIHLQRYQDFRDARKQRSVTEVEERASRFDEKAIYFFYGMFRVARLDFLATKGYVLYPRVWMEEAFSRMADSVIGEFMCGSETDLTAQPLEEAALYNYFGASRAMYHSGSKRPEEPIPDLFDFSKKLEAAEQTTAAKRPISDPQLEEIFRGYQQFQKRLEPEDSCILFRQITATFDAITALDDYAFNTLFSSWYDQFGSTPPTANLPGCPPDDFLVYPSDIFEAKLKQSPSRQTDWRVEREKAWKIVLDNVPEELKGSPSPCSKSSDMPPPSAMAARH